MSVDIVHYGPIVADVNLADSPCAGQVRQAIPLDRYGMVEDSIGAVAFPGEPDVRNIAGTTLDIDGSATTGDRRSATLKFG